MTKYKFDKKLEAESLRYIAEHEIPADEEEKADFEYWKTITPEDIPDMEQEEHDRVLAKVQQAFNNTKQALKEQAAKNKMISLRINENDLTVLKRKASRYGLKYQTYINMILHQVVTDRLVDDFRLILKTGTDNK